MYLEVILSNGQTVYHPFRKEMVKLGSGYSCDIVIPGTDISREHVILTKKGKDYFITDCGSSNGTFINGETIEPGIEKLLLADTHVRLGRDVVITIVSEDKTSAYSPDESGAIADGREDKTHIHSRNHLNQISTDEVVKKRPRFNSLKTKNTSVNSFLMQSLKVLVLVSLVFGVWFFTNRSKPEPVAKNVLVPSNNTVPDFPEKHVRKISNTYQYEVSGIPYVKHAVKLLNASPRHKMIDLDVDLFENRYLLSKVASLVFIQLGMDKLSPKVMKENRLEFIFQGIRSKNVPPTIWYVMAITPQALESIRKDLAKTDIQKILDNKDEVLQEYVRRMSLSVY